ncbi:MULTISPECIES: sensor histidine kinase [Corynebacterium]|uniref:sensor histidine kinase n=1 Tax=Corynebacterium TaxID=1716 RepID=UPI00257A9A1D|nr:MULTISPECIES: sensor histidine kinase [Corynebacterium]
MKPRVVQHSVDTEAFRNGIHILTATLLVVAILTSVGLPVAQAVLNLVLLAAFAVVYISGSIYVETWPLPAAYLWLIILSIIWVADTMVTPAAIYLVFALFFLYLYVLDIGVGSVFVVVATLISVAVQIPKGVTFGGVMGPAVSALVTVAIFFAFRALARMNAELMETRSQLAATERDAGMIAERQRIAHEIHDTVAQGLSSIQMLLYAADRDLDSAEGKGAEGSAAGAAADSAGIDKARERIELARTTAADNLHEARAMIAALQPAALADASLEGALERMARNFASTSSFQVEVDSEGEAVALPMKVEAALLRIAQGAVGNVVKHAGATRARITLTYGVDEVRMDVVDNGEGFDVAAVESRPAGLGHIGLAAMSRRAEELGGKVIIESAPGSGTAVSVSMPLANNVD